MKAVIEFIKDQFNFNTFVLFLISSVFLYYDSLDYNKKALHYEAKFAKYCAIFSIAIAIILYIVTKILP
ncbi:CLC_0170 family protein [Caloramator australicus]|uniref:Uncharacterized protein n=1 Tax=Caloramator australicus RC3 TaxID=857293 RepID=I7LIG7_9CLOT|nr:hypothetical protein CAAU_0868 [Caloramator australicus RC3]